MPLIRLCWGFAQNVPGIKKHLISDWGFLLHQQLFNPCFFKYRLFTRLLYYRIDTAFTKPKLINENNGNFTWSLKNGYQNL
jgi:hypothetical protein